MYGRNIFRSSSVVFGNLWQSLVIFGKCPKMFGKCSEAFVWPSEQFWKIFVNLWKVVGNLRKSPKTSSLVCLYNKQNTTCLLVDTNFIFSCSTQYLTHLLCSLVRCRVEHSKIKFVSMHGHVISSIQISLPVFQI